MPHQVTARIVNDDGLWVFEKDRLAMNESATLEFEVVGYAGTGKFEIQADTRGVFSRDSWTLDSGNGFKIDTQAVSLQTDKVEVYCRIAESPVPVTQRGAPSMRFIIRRT